MILVSERVMNIEREQIAKLLGEKLSEHLVLHSVHGTAKNFLVGILAAVVRIFILSFTV